MPKPTWHDIGNGDAHVIRLAFRAPQVCSELIDGHPLVEAAMVERRCVTTRIAVSVNTEVLAWEFGQGIGHGRSPMWESDLRPRANDTRGKGNLAWSMTG